MRSFTASGSAPDPCSLRRDIIRSSSRSEFIDIQELPEPKPPPSPSHALSWRRSSGEYLVNIVQGRRTAQERVTGGRWCRIVLGDVLVEHVVELRGRPVFRTWLPLNVVVSSTTTEVTARAHISRARLGLVLQSCRRVPLGCMQGGSRCPGPAVEPERARWHDPVLGRWLGLTPERPAL